MSYWNIVRIWKFAVPLVPVDEDFSFDFEDNELVEELTDSEAENVEGEGLVSAVIGAVGGAILGAVYYCCQEAVKIVAKGPDNYDTSGFAKGITEATVSGAVTGAAATVFFPIP